MWYNTFAGQRYHICGILYHKREFPGNPYPVLCIFEQIHCIACFMYRIFLCSIDNAVHNNESNVCRKQNHGAFSVNIHCVNNSWLLVHFAGQNKDVPYQDKSILYFKIIHNSIRSTFYTHSRKAKTTTTMEAIIQTSIDVTVTRGTISDTWLYTCWSIKRGRRIRINLLVYSSAGTRKLIMDISTNITKNNY